jgi:hypothetical protein
VLLLEEQVPDQHRCGPNAHDRKQPPTDIVLYGKLEAFLYGTKGLQQGCHRVFGQEVNSGRKVAIP